MFKYLCVVLFLAVYVKGETCEKTAGVSKPWDKLKKEWFELYSTSKTHDCSKVQYGDDEKGKFLMMVNLNDTNIHIHEKIEFNNDDGSYIFQIGEKNRTHKVVAIEDNYAVIFECPDSGEVKKDDDKKADVWILSKGLQLNANDLQVILEKIDKTNDIDIENLDTVIQGPTCSGAWNQAITFLVIISVFLTRLF